MARKAVEIPQLKEEIRNGNLSVSKIRKVCPVINEENQAQWIQAAKTKSCRELEMKVASLKTDHVPRVSLRAVAKETVRLSLDIDEVSREKIDRLKDLLSSKTGKDCSLQEVLDFALETALDKHDPLRKEKRAQTREKKKVEKKIENPGFSRTCHKTGSTAGSKAKAAATGHVTGSKTRRKALSKGLVHKIQRRNQGRCTFVGADGKRCGAKRWLQFHHILGVARGGKDVLDNLQTLCCAHHRMVHEKD